MFSPSKRRLRIAFVALLLLSLAAVGYGFAKSSTDTTLEQHLDGEGGVDEGAQIASESDGVTVVATDSNSWRGERSEGPRALAELVAFEPDGTVLYYDDSHTRYWDVDPVPGTQSTVEYSYADHLDGNECPAADEWNHSEYGVDRETWDTYYEEHGKIDACTYNGVERANLSTGETEEVWGHPTPGKEATRYHDVDRINDTHIVVADIYLDGILVANTETDEIAWRWNASDDIPTDGAGGPYPKDWSHINDVEVLEDDRIMVSGRNFDRALFVTPPDRAGGEATANVSADDVSETTNETASNETPPSAELDEEWTLGEEDDYEILYEQHNPDFINESNGGPAVVVADSENNRVLEYQRVDGEWEQTWVWRDARMQWPRDADRLPNGHTLITDSNGNRVFEVDEEGETVWSANVAFPYESERLGTGDESAGGPSAESADIASREGSAGDWFWITLKKVLPGKYVNGLMYVTPVWMGLAEVLALALGLVVALAWGATELRWYLGNRRS
ncbi:arylsulfotransferase family protein [Halegenticoccus tardaugens]|uniref:arylsulfotransferase family protein n=1 Tax=Halegenticoccus tardaugens TaxID=2071624 RepID=UPI00100BEBF0|nr:arylsulfotransferase family protein [Halegenticoccus tardaugens]